MRQVIGKQTLDLDADAFASLRDGRDVVLDLGTGDGKHAVHVARQRPDALVIGLDAQPDSMRDIARKAAAKPAKGGTPNALFVWGAVESLPVELSDVVEVHCLMPWGSLLRALARPDPEVLRGIAAICRDAAPFLITLNLHAWRPPVADVGGIPEPTPESVGDTLAEAGWTLTEAGYAEPDDLAALGTSWTKRLGSTRDELAVLLLRGTVQVGN